MERRRCVEATASLRELTISVVIPVGNGGESFRRCLLSLTEAEPSPWEVIVVADDDPDDSWHLAEDVEVQMLIVPTPGGPAKKRNAGARTSRGDILFFVDADVSIQKGTLGQIAAAFAAQPEMDALIGSYDDDPAAGNFLSQYKNLHHHYVHQTAREKASTFWGACGAIRREVFWAMGGFDERYLQPSVEDIEFGYRLKQAGHTIRLCKTLQVKHLKRWGFISLVKSDVFSRAIPWTGLILRHRQMIDDLNLKVSSRVSVIVTYGLLSALVVAAWWPASLALAAALNLSLLVLNMPLYRFFRQKRGLPFAIKVIPWHWFSYLYGGLAFVMGMIGYLVRRRRSVGVSLSQASEGHPETTGEAQ